MRGEGGGCITFWAKSDKNSDFHGNYGSNGENLVSTLAPRILIGSNSSLQVMSTSTEILDGFEIQQDPARDCGVSCPWVSKKIPRLIVGEML